MRPVETTQLGECTEALLTALDDARRLILDGATGVPLRDKLLLAGQLVDLMREGVNASPYHRSSAQALAYLSGEVKSLGSLIRPLR